jgi:hypothetical protein
MNADWIKMLQDLQKDKDYQKALKSTIDKEFEKIKNKYLLEFDNHPITQEIIAGMQDINAPNSSGTLGGITNLYSFIGFDKGTDPISPIRILLEQSSYKILNSTFGAESVVIFNTPTPKDIFDVTPMPWASGRSWARGIETGISGLGYYIKKLRNSRSGLGVQSQKPVRSGARFQNTKYISDLINRFNNDLKNLEK